MNSLALRVNIQSLSLQSELFVNKPEHVSTGISPADRAKATLFRSRLFYVSKGLVNMGKICDYLIMRGCYLYSALFEIRH